MNSTSLNTQRLTAQSPLVQEKEKSKLLEQSSESAWGQIKHETTWFQKTENCGLSLCHGPCVQCKGCAEGTVLDREKSGAQVPLPTPDPRSWDSW